MISDRKDMMDLGPQIPSAVAIGGVEYRYTKYSDFSEIEQAEVKTLTLRNSPLLERALELSIEDAAELDNALERLVDLFLQCAPAEIRKRLSSRDRVRIMIVVWDQTMLDAGLIN